MRRNLPPILLLGSLAWLICGCESVQSTFNTQGPAASRIATLSWAMVITFLLASLIMWGLLLVVIRHRGSLAEHAPVDAGGGQGWIAIGGLLIPLAVLCVFFVLGLNLLASFPLHEAQAQSAAKPDILVTGHQWWWEVQYLNGPTNEHFTTANEIHIPANQPVTLELKSADVIHAFWVPSLHGKVDLIPGHPNFIRIEATHPGNFAGECAEYCGEQHAHMRLLVVAESADEYQAWRQQMLKPSATPTSPDALAGEQVFMSAPCIMCHTVRGTDAGGRVAPDLTHLASRQFIAADSYPNDNADLEAWVTHAQSLKPGALMPDLTQFRGEELRELVAYLRQLR